MPSNYDYTADFADLRKKLDNILAEMDAAIIHSQKQMYDWDNRLYISAKVLDDMVKSPFATEEFKKLGEYAKNNKISWYQIINAKQFQNIEEIKYILNPAQCRLADDVKYPPEDNE